jgi:hypothetical protein
VLLLLLLRVMFLAAGEGLHTPSQVEKVVVRRVANVAPAIDALFTHQTFSNRLFNRL